MWYIHCNQISTKLYFNISRGENFGDRHSFYTNYILKLDLSSFLVGNFVENNLSFKYQVLCYLANRGIWDYIFRTAHINFKQHIHYSCL